MLPISAYRLLVSPFLAPRCRYYPTCSGYAIEAIREFGVVKGSVLAAWRVLRCNPWSDGGFDAVADQCLFKARPGGCGHAHPSTNDGAPA